MTCKDAIELFSEYLEAAVDSDTLARLEQHLRDCPPCVAYLNTFRRSRELAREASEVEMPPELKRRLRQFLLAHLRDS
jgi:predicted anti-sigma-YlaC factor YlaD